MGIWSQLRHMRRLVSGIQGHGPASFAWVCFFSTLAHLLFFAVVYWVHDFDFLPPKPKVVRVDLVSFAPGPETGENLPKSPETPEPSSDAVSLKPAPTQTTVPKPEPVPVLKPDVSLKSKPKNIKELMAARKPKPVEEKKTEKLKPKPKKNPEKELQKARQELAKKVEDQSKKQIDEALKRMAQAVEGQGQGLEKGPGIGAGTGKTGAGPLELYKMIIASAIRQNWVFNEALAGNNPNLETKVFVKILKSGEIRDVSFETRSGNRYLDESAKKAIRRSNPLPELPKGVSSFEAVLIFTPKGLK